MDPTAPESPPLRDAPAPEPAANLNLPAAVLVVDDSRTM